MRFHSNVISFLIPDFVEIQRSSFIFLLLDRFVKEFSRRKRIKSRTHNLNLFFYPEYYQLNYPKHSPTQAVLKGESYESRLYVPAQLVNWETKEVEIQWVLLGSLPLMTKRGHFIINGSPRVVVNQLVRSPGIYYSERYTKKKRTRIVWGDLIPQRGAWLRLTTDKSGYIWARVKKLSKISIPVLLRAFGCTDGAMKAEFPATWQYTPSNPESALASLSREASLNSRTYWTEGQAHAHGRSLVRRFKNRRAYNLSEAGRRVLNTQFGASVSKDRVTLTRDDILSAVKLLFKVIHDQRRVDDIDNLKNRRVRTSGELIGNQINVALSRLSKTIRKELSVDSNTISIHNLITTKPLNGSLREFFGLSPLSQYMDQTNPLAEITHKRRVTSLGPGGINRESAIQVRSIHPTYFGRVCPIETPEGKNAGLVSSVTIYSKISSQGFLRTPFHKTYKGQVQSKRGVSLFSANQEEEFSLASSDLQPSKLGFLPPQNVPVKVGKEYQSIPSSQVDYSAVSALQMLSVATSLIPFLEHNDANRALMGSNMQRQAVPLIATEVPTVGTGLEPRAAANSSHLVQSGTSGYVFYASGEKISVQPFNNKRDSYPLTPLYKASGHCHARHKAGSNRRGAVRDKTPTKQEGEKVCKTGFVFAGRVNCLLEPGSAKPHTDQGLGFAAGRPLSLCCKSCLPQTGVAKEAFDRQQAGLLPSNTQVVNNLERASCREWPTAETPLSTADSSEIPAGWRRRTGQRVEPGLLKRARAGFDRAAMAGKSFKPKPPANIPCVDQAAGASYCLPAFQSKDSMVCKSSVAGRKVRSWDIAATRQGVGTLSGAREQTALTGGKESSPLGLLPIQGGCLMPARGGVWSGNSIPCCNDQRNLARAVSFQGRFTPLPNAWFDLIEYELQVSQRSNQDTCFSQRPAVNEGDWVQKGDLLADSSSTVSGEVALGRNLLVAYMPWEGYNFEDAILISERLLYDNLFTSIHVERYRVEFSKEDFIRFYTPEIYSQERSFREQAIPSSETRYLDGDGIAKVGSWVVEGDLLVWKLTRKEKRVLTEYEKLVYRVTGRLPLNPIRNTSFRVPKGVEGRVVRIELDNLPQGRLDQETNSPDASRIVPLQEQYRGRVCMAANQSKVAIANLVSLYLSTSFYLEPSYRINVYLAESREIKVGDKMSGRHGNKGIVSKILPRQDMPYLPNGAPVDVVLNPLGVPSRMNVGQVFESLLGLAGVYLNQQFRIFPFDELYGPETSRALVYSKLYQARLKTGQSWLFNPETPGKVPLFDGRTGQLFDQSVTVGRKYMLKLIHLVDHKIHARSTGPYALVTQQPLRGKSKNGGQRVGEMEVWALEGFGAAHTLHELLTVKSDDMEGRRQVMFSILNERPITLGRPAAFKVLIRELQCMCLQVEFFQLRRDILLDAWLRHW